MADRANSPATLIRDALVAAIKAAGTGLPADQIRPAYDVSGEPRGEASVIVSCADLGGHAGRQDRILVDCRATVSILTHLDEDMTGGLADSILNAVIPAITGLNRSLDGWAIRYISPWTTEEPTTDGSFRRLQTTATMFTQRL